MCSIRALLFFRQNLHFCENDKNIFEVYCLLFSDAETKPSVVYLHFKPNHFQRFNDICNFSMDYIFRYENEEQTNEWENEKTVDVIIKVGVIGKFTDDNFKLLPEGKKNL